MLNPVQVRYSDDGGYIYVTVNPREVIQGQLSAEVILDALIETGFSSFEYQLEQAVLEELVRLPWSRLNRVIIRRIAYRVEFDLKVIVSPDRMSASVSVSPAYHQEQISRERFIERLSHSGVKRGLIEENIEQILSLGESQMLEIARGQPPENGRDSWLEILCTPLTRDQLNLVEPGMPLARRYPPTSGTDGFKVSGQVLPARAGLMLNLLPGEGCDFAPDDPNLLVATQQGLPVYSGLQIRVDPLIEVQADALEPFYLQSVLIQGDLPPNTQVKASGHLIIDGVVNGGELISEAELICRQDVQGPVWLQSAGDMQLVSVTQGLLSCGKNLRFEADLVHCQSFVGGRVLAPAGRLRGGALFCLDGAVLWEHGTEFSDQTLIQFGKTMHFHERLFSLQASNQDLKRELEELLKRLIRMRSQSGSSPETERMAQHQRALMFRDISLKGEMDILARVLDGETESEIVVRGTVYPNALYTFQDNQLLIEKEYPAVRLRAELPLKLIPLDDLN